jgi:hypothetical protein
MKKCILLFLFTVIVFSVKAQIINIPDANFKNAMLLGIVADYGDGILVNPDLNDDG